MLRRLPIIVGLTLTVSGILLGQGTCGLMPLKPITPIGCSDTTPTCICSGRSCRWEFVCESSTRASSPNTAIPLMIQPPHVEDLVDAHIKAQQLRSLRIQNDIQEARPAVHPQLATAQADSAARITNGHLNGRAWVLSANVAKAFYIAGFMDALATVDRLDFAAKIDALKLTTYLNGLYSEPANLSIPIPTAVTMFASKAEKDKLGSK